jgi:serine/threonine protein kinase
MIGAKLAHYEITSHLGSGGMGEVYQATDSKLGRSVAVKFLPESFAHDADRLARFEREARVLASLNHPNIAAIYGLENANDKKFLVMELVPGETLAERIKRGAIPVEEAVGIARQIAEALEAAHEKGIIHRDLKPANIKVTADGKVKVLDFGLAKAFEQEPSNISMSNSPTMSSMAATNAGMILGTAAYMSPEQAVGKPVDKRSDLWAFGVVLMEMLTGHQVFQGETVSHLLASVLKDTPDWAALPANATTALRRLLRRCLEKNRRKRLADAADICLELEDALTEPPEIAALPVAAPPSRERLWMVLAALFLIGLAAVSAIHFREKPAATPLLRYTVAAPNKASVHSLAISPDGRMAVLATFIEGKRQLWLRQMDALQWQAMPGTDDARYPFWSPDSRYIGFFAEGKLRKIAAGGGPSQTLCDAADGRGGTWNRDDVIVFSPAGAPTDGVLQRVPAAGGVPTVILTPGTRVLFPAFLHDGNHLLYTTAGMSAEQNGIYVVSLNGKENRRILADASGAVWVSPASGARNGHILFIRENNLMAQPFDAGSLQISGDVFPVAEGTGLTNGTYYVPVTASDTGVLLYSRSSASGTNAKGAWFDRSGKPLGPAGDLANLAVPAISPDDKSVVFMRVQNGLPISDLWVRDLARGTETRFTNDPSVNWAAFWSPKGDRIVFSSNRGGTYNLYVKNSSGSEPEQILLKNGNNKLPSQWSQDGKFVVYLEVDPKSKYHIWVLPMEIAEQDRKPIPFLQTEFNEMMGQLSPNGHWMAYMSDQSGRREVYVRPFPHAEGQWTISAAGGDQPRWRGDGKELYFQAADGKLMSVPVTRAVEGPKPEFETDAPVTLFDAHIAPTPNNNATQYDVTADGKRFLIATYAAGTDTSAPALNVVVNWNASAKK